MDLEGRMGRTERRLDATLKIVQTGMKMLVKMQQDTRDFKKEVRDFKGEMRDFKNETQRGINALIAAQMRTDAKLDRLVDALLRTHSNGRTN
jgi:hypothetical protein